jgi:DNA polymerase-3 subunit beta
MHLTIRTEDLQRGISTVSKAVSQRSTLPVLANILIEAKDGRVKFAATNLEMGIVCWVPADIEEEGAITVPARLLSEYVGQISGKDATIEVNRKTMSLEMRSGNNNARIKGIGANEFPVVPEGRGDGSVQAGALVLADAIKGVVFAAAADESRPTLTGVHMLFHGETLTMACTDGFRLAVRGVVLRSSVGKDKIEVVVPASAMSEVARIINARKDLTDSDYVEIVIRETQVRFCMEGVEITSQVIDANFPNYRAIIPSGMAGSVVLRKDSIVRVLNVANLFARDSMNVVRWQIGKDDVVLSAESAEMGDGSGRVNAEVTGSTSEPFVIAFNGRYMLDAINAMGTDKVRIDFVKPNAPGVVRPAYEQNAEALCVVMPMHISK